MTPELILYLLSWATFFSGYPMPDELPVIEFRPHSYFVMRMCNNFESAEDPCPVTAMYSDYDSGILYLDRIFNQKKITSKIESIIVHEMIHYLQDLSGKYKDIDSWEPNVACDAKDTRQREAYYAQDAYMRTAYGLRRSRVRKHIKCGEFK